MARPRILGAAAVLLVTACTHDSAGRWVRRGDIRFDERSITGPNVTLKLEDDGTWSHFYFQQGDEIRSVGGFEGLIRSSGWVEIERRPDGLYYEPSWPISNIWTFVTEDGQPLPATSRSRSTSWPSSAWWERGSTSTLPDRSTPGWR